MTIKILKKGNMTRLDPTFEVGCGNCGCEFECSKSDCRYTSDLRDGDFYAVACPTCRRNVLIGAEVVKEKVAARAAQDEAKRKKGEK